MSVMQPIKKFVQSVIRCMGYEIRRTKQLKPASDHLFEQWLALLRQSGPIATVFDVGANRGQTMKVFRPQMPEASFYAFEPFSLPFVELQRLAEKDGRIKPFQLALGDENCTATLHQNFVEDTNSLLKNSTGSERFAPPEWMTPIGSTNVQVARLDEVFRGESLERIDILKIDAQGYERRILDGAGSLLNPKTIRGVMLEILFVPYYEGQAWGGELIELMRAKGYRLYGLSCVYYNTDYGWHWADALFVAGDEINAMNHGPRRTGYAATGTAAP